MKLRRKEKKIKPKKTELNFVKVKKQKQVLDNMINKPIIFVYKKRKFEYTYAARIDGYEMRTIFVYDLHLVVRSESNSQEFEWLPTKDILPGFYLPEITSIYTPKDSGLGLKHAMESWLNPFVKPIRGIQCDWVKTGKHSKFCNDDLHEALSFIYKKATRSTK